MKKPHRFVKSRRRQTKRVYGANESTNSHDGQQDATKQAAGSNPARAMMLVEVIRAPPVCSPRSSSEKVQMPAQFRE